MEEISPQNPVNARISGQKKAPIGPRNSTKVTRFSAKTTVKLGEKNQKPNMPMYMGGVPGVVLGELPGDWRGECACFGKHAVPPASLGHSPNRAPGTTPGTSPLISFLAFLKLLDFFFRKEFFAFLSDFPSFPGILWVHLGRKSFFFQ